MNRNRIKIIQEAVCEEYGISLEDMLSERRFHKIAHPRQIAMYLAFKLSTASSCNIGDAFDRDHTTVLHAIKVIERHIERDAIFAQRVAGLEAIITDMFKPDDPEFVAAQKEAAIKAQAIAKGFEASVMHLAQTDPLGFMERIGEVFCNDV